MQTSAKMYKAIAVIGLVVVLTLSSTMLTIRSAAQNSGTSVRMNTIQGLSGYQGCVDASNEASGFSCYTLSKIAVAIKPASNSSLGWSAVFYNASYDYVMNTPQSALQQELSMLFSSGASCIRIDIGYDAWLTGNVTAQDELKSFASQITSSGKCLIIADASAEYYRSSPLPWAQFQAAWVQRVSTLAGIFKPSYYIVVKEPGWYVPMISDASNNSQFLNATVWQSLTQSLASAVKHASPNSKVGVSVEGGIQPSYLSYYLTYLKGVSAMKNISFIGYDQYGTRDMALDAWLQNQVQSTKSVWITEAWSTDINYTTGNYTMYDPDRASLDAYWIQVLYYYALAIHASVIEPFYTNAFSSYSPSANYTQRTFVFYWFQHLATEYDKPIPA